MPPSQIKLAALLTEQFVLSDLKGAVDGGGGLIHSAFITACLRSSYLNVSPSRLVLNVVRGTDFALGFHLHLLVEYLVLSSPCGCQS